ncbi:uncharacterized protein LOC101846021 [Aplysia californica]|uniref:XK-related protein n=1 Tax=Aplysia californica TaxID=6500 RepID=A0ABM0JYL0_APLCA|nr:uncharacterized protein LOC101846021 [Aplysia californica]
MTSTQLSPRFVVFVVVSLISHLLELAASGLLCHALLQQGQLKTPWFSVAAGLLIIPLVLLQLASAVLTLRRKGDSASGCEVTATAILHLLQLGFISRHFAVLQEAPPSTARAELAEMIVLRLAFALSSGCTLLLLQGYLLLSDAHEPGWAWAVYVVALTTLLSVTWALATFRRRASELDLDSVLITWPGTVLKVTWRGGEVLVRVLCLGLFASLYTHWIFLVLGLHWLAMAACLCIPVITALDWRGAGSGRRAVFCLLTSFAYIFAFINTSAENAVFRYTFYYVVLFLENATLIAVWLVQCSSAEFERNSVYVYIAAPVFAVYITAMIVYYKFFHVAGDKAIPGNIGCSAVTACASCKLGSHSAHPPIPPRPGVNGGWLQSAVYCGQYYKHAAQDSLLDSVSERNSTATVSSSHARLQHKLATIHDHVSEHEGSEPGPPCSHPQHHHHHPYQHHDHGVCPVAVSQTAVKSEAGSPRGKLPRRKEKKKKSLARNTTSESELSSVRTDCDMSEGSGSNKRPVWLPSGDSNFANQLLNYSLETFDTADTADDERSSVATGCHGYHANIPRSPRGGELSSPRHLHQHHHQHHHPVPGVVGGASLQRHGDHHWYSDGYSTDRTLDWPRLPMTSLQRGGVWGMADTESEGCTGCQCCHGDSEVSSIMRSITSVPEPTDETQDEGQNSEGYHSQPRGHKHSHRPHHHHHHERSLDPSSGCNKKQKLDKFSPRDLNTVSENNRLSKHSKISTKDSGFRREEILSSPASDPSYGPKAKRKHSPRRKVHTSEKYEKATSKSKVLDDPISINNCLPQVTMCSDDKDVEEETVVQSDKLASELLQHSVSGDKKRKKDRINSSSAGVSDPRFSVRVMADVTDVLEEQTSHVRSLDQGQVKGKGKGGSINSPRVEEPNKGKGINDESQVEETNKDTYAVSAHAKNKSKVSRVPSSSLAVDNANEELKGVEADNVPDEEKEKESEGQEASPNTSESGERSDEIIYENIWQVKPPLVKPSLLQQVRGVTSVPSKPCRKTAGKDVWYVCSESEDSALPPEALSSSVDGFTASDESDISMEIVI